MGHVIPSVLEDDPQKALGYIEGCPVACERVELRADTWPRDALEFVLDRATRPLLVTVRRTAEGGAFAGSEGDRRALLQCAVDRKAARSAPWIDVEHDSDLAAWALAMCPERLVLSHHGGPCTKEALIPRWERMAQTPAAVLKIVPEAQRPGQGRAILELLALARSQGRPLAAFAMGRAGAWTRILTLSHGGWATYGALTAQRRTAAGQFSVEELLDIFQVQRLGPDTRRFALIGRDVFGSPSPAMHRSGFAELGLDACYFPLEADDLDDLDEVIGAVQLNGLAVTLPFKSAVAARCDQRDPVAQACGAVNTVRLEGDQWHGFNTDGPAAKALVAQQCALQGARVAILGAGGTARALAWSLADAGADVMIHNRSESRGRALAAELKLNWSEKPRPIPGSYDVLVNATPLGSAGETVIEGEDLDPGCVVVDAVYRPGGTPLALACAERGLPLVDGLALLVGQGILQFEHLTGQSLPRPQAGALMAQAAQRWLERRRRST